jgi:pimeloyl-ACP methyl ester carboxylesterase
VPKKRPKGVLAMGWAAIEAAVHGRTEHVPTEARFPENVVRRTSFTAGGGHGWRISALQTPRETPAPWKIVVITGAPSWAEYWAETLAALPADREMIVVDRPGYAGSEPLHPVTDIRVQAEALAPALAAAPGQKVLLVGQSYGAAIASIMADQNPGRVAGLVLLSGFFGEAGPTAKWLLDVGARALKVIPKDLRHAVIEVTGQKPQLRHAKRALARLNIPIHIIHGDQDDFAPLEAAEQLAAETVTRRPIRVIRTEGANHFLNDGPTEVLLNAIEDCIPKRQPAWTFRWPKLPQLWTPKLPKSAASPPPAAA